MSMNDTLAAMLSMMCNAERVGKKELLVKPVSKVMQSVLELLKEQKYIAGYTLNRDAKGNYLTVSLAGNINKCGPIKPRHALQKNAYEKFEKRYLIANNFGILIVSTPHGMMTHNDAKKKGIGGRLIAYCY